MASTALQDNSFALTTKRAAVSTSASVLTDIYQDDVNIAVWQGSMTPDLTTSVERLLAECPNLRMVVTSSPEDVTNAFVEQNPTFAKFPEFCQHIATLVDMFATLFELKRVGIRLTQLDRAMCPKFHVDRVPCRLVSTFFGVATQWLPHESVDRTKLGAGSLGLSDEQSGIYQHLTDIQQLNIGDVALLKGETWYNNEGAGLVHRSPAVADDAKRLLLTLDFID